MWKTIARKEIAANLVSYKFFIVILLACVLIFTSLFVMSRDYKARKADYELIKPEPGAAIAVLPPNPLSIFALGLDDAIARSFEISVTGIQARSGKTSGNLIFGFFPAPDFVYVVKIVLSLVALLFGFDLVTREREDGTLKLMLANPVSRAAVLAGKWAGNFLSLAVPILLAVGFGIVLLSLDRDIRWTGFAFGRLALIVGASLAYLALFLTLGLFVSAATRRSASSLVLLLLAWAAIVFILPNLGTLLARQLVEVPSVRAMTEKRNQIWTRDRMLAVADHKWAERAVALNEELDRLGEDYRIRLERLVGLSKTLNRISPAACYVYAATEIAGTGIGEEDRLKQEVVRYKNRVLAEAGQPAKNAPAFVYRYRTTGEVLASGGLFDLAELVCLSILLFVAAYAAIVRYDVR